MRPRALQLFFILSIFAGFAVISLQTYLENYLEKPKNIILISIDTLRTDSMGTYGYNKNTTPNIDRFAKNAVVYSNAYTQIPATYPSFASLMTGLTPFESGIYSNGETEIEGKPTKTGRNAERSKIDEKTKTLAAILKENNYFTKALLTNVVLGGERTFLDRGFDEYKTFSYQYGKTSHGPIINETLSWMDKSANIKNPFFLWIHFLDPHSPYTPSREYVEKGYNLEEFEMVRSQPCRTESLDKDFVNFYKALYDGEIAMTDKAVGRILDKIHELNLDKNSIIVIYGDHGESFEHHLYFEHLYTLYEPLIRIPVIIYDPDNKRFGERVDDSLMSSDFFTILLNKLNITSTTEKNKQNNSESVFSMNTQASKFAIRKGDYKYIYSLEHDECSPFTKRELYNLKNDPEELTNLINRETIVVNALHKELIAFIENKDLSSSGKMGNSQPKYEDDSQITDEKRQKIIDDLKSLGY
jgi:arylsulfatase A-like enzyme